MSNWGQVRVHIAWKLIPVVASACFFGFGFICTLTVSKCSVKNISVLCHKKAGDRRNKGTFCPLRTDTRQRAKRPFQSVCSRKSGFLATRASISYNTGTASTHCSKFSYFNYSCKICNNISGYRKKGASFPWFNIYLLRLPCCY